MIFIMNTHACNYYPCFNFFLLLNICILACNTFPNYCDCNVEVLICIWVTFCYIIFITYTMTLHILDNMVALLILVVLGSPPFQFKLLLHRYSPFRVSCPICPLHTSITHVSKALEPQSHHWIPMAINTWGSAVPVATIITWVIATCKQELKALKDCIWNDQGCTGCRIHIRVREAGPGYD